MLEGSSDGSRYVDSKEKKTQNLTAQMERNTFIPVERDLQKILAKSLVEAPNYRRFLADYFTLLKERKKQGYADFARRAGFSSRAYPRDVLLNKRRISASSLPRFIDGAGLTGDLALYFKYIVAEEETDLAFDGVDRELLSKRKSMLREKIIEKYVNEPESGDELSKLYRIFEWPIIYASLGDENGATVDEISARSGLGTLVVKRALDALAEQSLVSYNPKTGKYTAISPQVYIKRMKDLGFFKSYFLDNLKTVKARAQTHFEDKKNLFLCASLSIDQDKMGDLVKELEKTALNFIANAESSNGNVVANLTIAFHKY